MAGRRKREPKPLIRFGDTVAAPGVWPDVDPFTGLTVTAVHKHKGRASVALPSGETRSASINRLVRLD